MTFPFVPPAQDDGAITIEQITTPQQLQSALDAGLAALYSRVFAEAPYFESISVAESRDIFSSYLKKDGIIFAAFAGGVPAGFSVGIPLAAKPDVAALVSGAVDVEKSVYFADAGVDPALRRRNLSVTLKKCVMDAAVAAGYTAGISRTSRDSYNQISAFNKVGGKIVTGVYQDVESLRLDGSVAADRRVFYAYDLTVTPDVRSVDNVAVYRGGAGDIAVVQGEKSAAVVRGLRGAYPGLCRVSFNAAACRGQTPVFCGRMYLSDKKAPKPLS